MKTPCWYTDCKEDIVFNLVSFRSELQHVSCWAHLAEGVLDLEDRDRCDDAFPELRGDRPAGFGSSANAKAVLAYWMDSFGERHAEEK